MASKKQPEPPKPPAEDEEIDERASVPPHSQVEVEATIVGGAIAGAALGSIAGPAGTVVGGLIGTGAGLLAGGILEEQHARDAQHDAELDKDIGVTEGDLGAASPDQPKSKHGLFHASSLGVHGGGGGSEGSEGTMQNLDE